MPLLEGNPDGVQCTMIISNGPDIFLSESTLDDHRSQRDRKICTGMWEEKNFRMSSEKLK